MPPESIESWSGWLTSIAVWSGAIAAAAGVLALIFANWDADNKKAELNRFQSEAQERTAKLENETTAARLELEKIRERQNPRALTQEWQKSAAIELSKFTGQRGTIIASPSTAESEWFARSLGAPLREAGWDIEIIPGTATATLLFPRGVVIGYPTTEHTSTDSPDAANKLAALLTTINIEASAIPSRMSAETTIQITISER